MCISSIITHAQRCKFPQLDSCLLLCTNLSNHSTILNIITDTEKIILFLLFIATISSPSSSCSYMSLLPNNAICTFYICDRACKNRACEHMIFADLNLSELITFHPSMQAWSHIKHTIHLIITFKHKQHPM